MSTRVIVEMPGMWQPLNLAHTIHGMLKHGGTPETVGLVVFEAFIDLIARIKVKPE